MDRLNRSVFSDVELRELDRSLVRAAAGSLCIVIEQIPLAVDLNNGVMCCPTDNRLHDPSLVCERSFRRITYRVAEVMCGSC